VANLIVYCCFYGVIHQEALMRKFTLYLALLCVNGGVGDLADGNRTCSNQQSARGHGFIERAAPNRHHRRLLSPSRSHRRIKFPQADQPAPASVPCCIRPNVPEVAAGPDVPKGAEIKAVLEPPSPVRLPRGRPRFDLAAEPESPVTGSWDRLLDVAVNGRPPWKSYWRAVCRAPALISAPLGHRVPPRLQSHIGRDAAVPLAGAGWSACGI